MQISININGPNLSRPSNKTITIVGLTGVAVLLIIFGVWRFSDRNPLPSLVKNQVDFGVLYPAKTSMIDSDSYDYEESAKTLNFDINYRGTKVVFTEQVAPDSLTSNGQAYYPALGLRPYAQFQSKFGPVALAKFWESGSLKPVGQSAILAHKGTLIIAHSDEDLTNAEWKDLMNSLKITK